MTKSGTIQEIAFGIYFMSKSCLSISFAEKPLHTVLFGDIVGGGHLLSLLGSSFSIQHGSTFSLSNNKRGVTPIGCLTTTLPNEQGRSACIQHYLFDEKSSIISKKHPVEFFDSSPEQHKPTECSSLIRRYDYSDNWIQKLINYVIQ
jgi:hypothetical protein